MLFSYSNITSGSYRMARDTSPWPLGVQRSGESVTCWKNVSIASRSIVNRAPSAARDLPLVRSKSRTDPQAPLDALSNISKSNASLESFPWNQDHFNCPIASEIGKMRAADAILESIVMTVRPRVHFPSGWSWRHARVAMIAPVSSQSWVWHSRWNLSLPMQIALIATLRISNNQRLNTFCDALYCANFRSMREVRSKLPSPWTEAR
jgi:hypothetical protein